MKCLSCGDNVCWVITKNTAICDKCGAEHNQEGLFWNCCLLETRAEKAEGELKAIKARIEALSKDDWCIGLTPPKLCNGNEECIFCLQEELKKIGGVK